MPVEFSLIFNALKPLLWFLPVLLLIAFLKSPLVKGWFGEKLIEKKGNRRLAPSIYIPFHNVTIPDDCGTTQIDHVYVSQFGIFVVETKNYKGWIFGSERDAQWTQTIYGKKSRFQNPLRQNYRHTKSLAALLGIPDTNFHSVVVFVGECELKTKLPDNVCTLANFDRHILSFQSKILSAAQVNAACESLASGRLAVGAATNRVHVRNLKKNQQ